MPVKENEVSFAGDLIRKRRLEQAISQVSAAESMGFTNAFLNRVEHGHCDLPAKYVDKLAHILRIDREDIIKALKKDLGARLEKRAK